MDPVTTAIITALSAGTIAGLTDTAKTAITDGYNKLKSLLTKKHGKDSDIVKAIENLEAKPDSKARKDVLIEEIATVKAEQDDEILTAANQILVLVKSQQTSQKQYHDSSGSREHPRAKYWQSSTYHAALWGFSEGVEIAGKHGRAAYS